MSAKDNFVEFRLNGIKIKSFDVKDRSVTDDKTYGGVHVSGANKLNVRADREGSETVAKWFKEKAESGVVVACDTNDSYPAKLNFAVYGTFTFEFATKEWIVENMLLAQGHNARSRNNWWVGGPYMQGGSVNPFIGAAVSSASVNGLPTGKVGFIAPPGIYQPFRFGSSVVGLSRVRGSGAAYPQLDYLRTPARGRSMFRDAWLRFESTKPLNRGSS